MLKNFDEWLVDQQSREDFIGELARFPGLQEIKHGISRRKSDDHKKWAEIVISIAEPGYIDIFNQAWQEFLLAQLAAKDAGD